MGSDERVVDAARVSFHKEASNYTDEQNDKLIDFLARNNHFTPFTHVQITMRERVPIFVARQRFKHMVGFTYNEVSRRYVDDAPEFFVPDRWRARADNKKQGSSDEEVKEIEINWGNLPWNYEDVINVCVEYYEKMIEGGVAPEQARMVLPQSMYTTYYCTGSLAAWARAVKLRRDGHAQKEIQELSIMWDKTIRELSDLKHSWEALVGDKWY